MSMSSAASSFPPPKAPSISTTTSTWNLSSEPKSGIRNDDEKKIQLGANDLAASLHSNSNVAEVSSSSIEGQNNNRKRRLRRKRKRRTTATATPDEDNKDDDDNDDDESSTTSHHKKQQGATRKRKKEKKKKRRTNSPFPVDHTTFITLTKSTSIYKSERGCPPQQQQQQLQSSSQEELLQPQNQSTNEYASEYSSSSSETENLSSFTTTNNECNLNTDTAATADPVAVVSAPSSSTSMLSIRTRTRTRKLRSQTIETMSRQERILSQWPPDEKAAIPEDFLATCNNDNEEEKTKPSLEEKKEIATKTVKCLKKRRRFYINGDNIDEDPIMKQMEHFISHLPYNEVFDLPFQIHKVGLPFAWCPCGPQMKAWREQCHINESFVIKHSYGQCPNHGMTPTQLLKHVRQVAGYMKNQQKQAQKANTNDDYDDEEHVDGWIHLGIQHYLENLNRDCYLVFKKNSSKWNTLKEANNSP